VFSTAADNQNAVSIHVLQGEREMASGNRTLGRFDLVGIPPAPRGVPQIEVTFDIDANGITHVSAKDLGTGKEQKIRIESSSGLSKEEIEKMTKDAAAHAEEDKKQRELIETRNHLDALVYSTEKSMNDLGDKISADEKTKVQDAIAKAKEALKSSNVDEIKSAETQLTQASHKIAEEMYKKAGAQQQGAPGPDGAQAGAAKEDVQDAEYKVNEDK
jgi:molecular chaperone DnaK